MCNRNRSATLPTDPNENNKTDNTPGCSQTVTCPDTNRHALHTSRVKQPLPHNRLYPPPRRPPSPRNCCASHHWPLCDPFDPSGSSERARGIMGLTRRGPMGPMGHHTATQAHAVAALVIVGPMRPIPWDRFRPTGLIGKSPRTPLPPWTSFERAPWVTRDSSKWVPWGAIRGPWGSPDGAHGPHGPPKDA
jgi:hypothetical protein